MFFLRSYKTIQRTMKTDKNRGKYFLGLAIIFIGILFVYKLIETKEASITGSASQCQYDEQIVTKILQFIKTQQTFSYPDFKQFLVGLQYSGPLSSEHSYIMIYSLMHN